jgi:hypothetical protein
MLSLFALTPARAGLAAGSAGLINLFQPQADDTPRRNDGAS